MSRVSDGMNPHGQGWLYGDVNGYTPSQGYHPGHFPPPSHPSQRPARLAPLTIPSPYASQPLRTGGAAYNDFVGSGRPYGNNFAPIDENDWPNPPESARSYRPDTIGDTDHPPPPAQQPYSNAFREEGEPSFRPASAATARPITPARPHLPNNIVTTPYTPSPKSYDVTNNGGVTPHNPQVYPMDTAFNPTHRSYESPRHQPEVPMTTFSNNYVNGDPAEADPVFSEKRVLREKTTSYENIGGEGTHCWRIQHACWIIYSIYALIYMIVGAVYLNDNTDLKGGCWNIWEVNLASVVIKPVMIIGFPAFMYLYWPSPEKMLIGLMFWVLLLFNWIWLLWVYAGIGTTCSTIIKTNYWRMWVLFVYSFWSELILVVAFTIFFASSYARHRACVPCCGH